MPITQFMSTFYSWEYGAKTELYALTEKWSQNGGPCLAMMVVELCKASYNIVDEGNGPMVMNVMPKVDSYKEGQRAIFESLYGSIDPEKLATRKVTRKVA